MAIRQDGIGSSDTQRGEVGAMATEQGGVDAMETIQGSYRVGAMTIRHVG